MAKQSLVDAIKDKELILAKYKAVLSIFPDAILTTSWTGYDQSTHISSKTVNSQYNKLSFENAQSGIVVIPYYDFSINYEDEDHPIKVHSIPKSSRLVYTRWNDKKTIRFSRLAINLKTHSFKEDMLNECRVQIMNFIKAHPDCKLDEKHLEPRLKKLIMFT